MEYIRITKDNLEKEHICCAISNNNDVQVSSKKAWLADRLDEGLVFLKSTERGKCFIEYIPAENAWVPILADGYMYIDCLWVSGSLKGHGYSTDLLNECIKDSKEKGKKGLCILAAAKKKPFLADPKFLNYKGFAVCDEADNGIQLWYLPFDKEAEKPECKTSSYRGKRIRSVLHQPVPVQRKVCSDLETDSQREWYPISCHSYRKQGRSTECSNTDHKLRIIR